MELLEVQFPECLISVFIIRVFLPVQLKVLYVELAGQLKGLHKRVVFQFQQNNKNKKNRVMTFDAPVVKSHLLAVGSADPEL